jgi:hypothetical protein
MATVLLIVLFADKLTPDFFFPPNNKPIQPKHINHNGSHHHPMINQYKQPFDFFAC